MAAAIPAFTGPYQSIYDAAMARINATGAAKKGAALRGAAQAGVMTSGVGQMPNQAIDKETQMEGADLAGNVAGKQYQDTIDLANQKDLLQFQAGLSQAAQERQYQMNKKLSKQNQLATLGGAGLAGLGTYLAA